MGLREHRPWSPTLALPLPAEAGRENHPLWAFPPLENGPRGFQHRPHGSGVGPWKSHGWEPSPQLPHSLQLGPKSPEEGSPCPTHQWHSPGAGLPGQALSEGRPWRGAGPAPGPSVGHPGRLRRSSPGEPCGPGSQREAVDTGGELRGQGLYWGLGGAHSRSLARVGPLLRQRWAPGSMVAPALPCPWVPVPRGQPGYDGACALGPRGLGGPGSGQEGKEAPAGTCHPCCPRLSSSAISACSAQGRVNWRRPCRAGRQRPVLGKSSFSPAHPLASYRTGGECPHHASFPLAWPNCYGDQ